MYDIADRLRELELESLHAAERGTEPQPVLYRDSGSYKGVLKADQADSPLMFVASEESPDRMGDVIVAAGWGLENFRKNPVFMLAHQHSGLPIGTVPDVRVDGKQLLSAVEFDKGDPQAMAVKGKYERGIMRAVSVGFRPLSYEEVHDGGKFKGLLFKQAELLEISAVSVPAHQNALMRAMDQASARKLFSFPGRHMPGQHDQETHGNWALGGVGQEIFADLIRSQQECGDDRECVSGWVERYAQSHPDRAEKIRQLDSAATAWKNNTSQVRPGIRQYLAGDRSDKDATVLMNSIEAAPPTTKQLYRGLSVTQTSRGVAEMYAPGKVVDIDIGSFSEEFSTANSYAEFTQADATPTKIVFTLQPGAKALYISPFDSGAYSWNKEWLTSGRFEVVKRTKVNNDDYHLITLKQVGTWQPKGLRMSLSHFDLAILKHFGGYPFQLSENGEPETNPKPEPKAPAGFSPDDLNRLRQAIRGIAGGT